MTSASSSRDRRTSTVRIRRSSWVRSPPHPRRTRRSCPRRPACPSWGDDGRTGLRRGGRAAYLDRVNLKLFGEVFVTLLVIVDPPGMVPVFLALTGTLPVKERVRAGTQAVLLALGVIVIFAVAGQTLLDYLHVQLPSLQGAGGLLLILVALQLLTGKTDEPAEQGGTSNVALVPLGTPLLAGPGAIVATMLFAQRADGVVDQAILFAGIIAVMIT